MTDNTQPEALDLAFWLEAVGGGPSAKRCAALENQHARITKLESQLESQLAQRFDAAGQATAAQAVVQDDLITIRKPTTKAELLWLLKLAHLVISDVDKTLEKTFAPAQPAAQQGVAYAASLIENLHL